MLCGREVRSIGINVWERVEPLDRTRKVSQTVNKWCDNGHGLTGREGFG